MAAENSVQKRYFSRRSLDVTPIVTQSNDFIRAKLEIENNALSNKIFCLLISEIKPETFPNVTVNVTQLALGSHLDGKAYKSIEIACKILNKASVHQVFIGKNNKEIGFSYKTVIPDIVYENGKIKATFLPALKEHLIDLHKQFVRFNLDELLKISSFYSQRIFEFLKSFESLRTVVKVDIDIFCDIIGITGQNRKDFSYIRRRALEVAQKDLAESTSISFDWFKISKGQKVEAIGFLIFPSSRSDNKISDKKGVPDAPETKDEGLPYKMKYDFFYKKLCGHELNDKNVKSIADLATKLDIPFKFFEEKVNEIIGRYYKKPSYNRKKTIGAYLYSALRAELNAIVEQKFKDASVKPTHKHYKPNNRPINITEEDRCLPGPIEDVRQCERELAAAFSL
jgi:hypothetical protein